MCESNLDVSRTQNNILDILAWNNTVDPIGDILLTSGELNPNIVSEKIQPVNVNTSELLNDFENIPPPDVDTGDITTDITVSSL